jgi:hypothetical protein
MTTTIISSGVAYGQMTNQAIGKLINLQTVLTRLQDAITTASAGYAGVPGTEFEFTGAGFTGAMPNLFGVQASETPGEQGSAYSYAMGRLHEEWAKFWTLAEPFIEQLDNGSYSA